MTYRTLWIGDYGNRQRRDRNSRDYQCRLDWENSDTPETRAERNRLLRSWRRSERPCAVQQTPPLPDHSATEKRRQADTGEGFFRFRRLFDWQKQGVSNETNIPGNPTGHTAS